MTAGVRDLKANLSSYLRRVRAGASITVTDRGRAIAVIQPAGSQAADVSWVHQMVSEGKASWSGGKPRGLTSPLKLRGKGKTVSEMLIEDRQ
jgi:prevent-host-death family protein